MEQEKILKNFKSENKLFIETLNKINIVDLSLSEYLKESLKSEDKTKLCNGWDYLKNNITKELKEILISDSKYWSIDYLDSMRDYLLKRFLTTEEINKIEPDVSIDHHLVGVLSQLKSFVYVWNGIKRECAKKEKEQNLKIDLEKQGYKEIDTIRVTREELKTISNEDLDKKYKDHYIKYDGLKVLCVLDVNAIGMLGSFDKKVAKEGKLFYSESQKALMLIPKRCRTRGYTIRKKCYIKEVA